MKRKIIAVITARPSYSRIKTFLEELKNNDDFHLLIALSSSSIVSNYGDIRNVLKNDGFIVDFEISNMFYPQGLISMSKTTSMLLYELSIIFNSVNPDAVISIADRYETIGISLAAAYSNIPLIHVQGGEITGNIDEKTRHANTKLADLHLVSSEKAKRRVIQMGENPSKVINCGCPSIDLARKAINSNYEINLIIDKYKGIGKIVKDFQNNYIVVLQHPTTDHYLNAEDEISITLRACLKFDGQVFVFWPNADAGTDGTSKGIRKFREDFNPNNFYFFKNFDPEDFIRLIKNSKMLIGNSSVGIRESSYLGIPVINIGNRQENRDRGDNVIDVNSNQIEIERSINLVLNNNFEITPNLIYGDGFAGVKMVKALSNFDFSFTKSFIEI